MVIRGHRMKTLGFLTHSWSSSVGAKSPGAPRVSSSFPILTTGFAVPVVHSLDYGRQHLDLRISPSKSKCERKRDNEDVSGHWRYLTGVTSAQVFVQDYGKLNLKFPREINWFLSLRFVGDAPDKLVSGLFRTALLWGIALLCGYPFAGTHISFCSRKLKVSSEFCYACLWLYQVCSKINIKWGKGSILTAW